MLTRKKAKGICNNPPVPVQSIVSFISKGVEKKKKKLKQGLLAVNTSANIPHSRGTPPAIFTINYQWQAYS